MSPSRVAFRLLVSATAVAVVTGGIFGLREVAPVLSLGVLYVFAVLPIAIVYGLAYGLAVSIASMLAFNFFFLAPVHTLALSDSENWVALAVYLVTAVVVSELAALARRRAVAAAEAEAPRRSDAVQDRGAPLGWRAARGRGGALPRHRCAAPRLPAADHSRP